MKIDSAQRIDSQSRRRRNLSSEHGAREGEARRALPDEGTTRAIYEERSDLATTGSERGRLHVALPLEGATRAPGMERQLWLVWSTR